jgi:predicted O-methyltransferase YrrM/glycosyltransferase involved in cell wall biosynthesis
MISTIEKPFISTTLINWNREDLLKITIESYLDTISVPYELFIVDNNSSDGSQKVIENFSKKNSHIKTFFLHENLGGEAINIGLEASSALLLHVTENDIEYLPGWDSKVIEYFNNFPNLGQLSLFGPVPEDEEVWYPKPSVLRYSNDLILYEALENIGTTSVFRKEIWDNNIRFGVIRGKEGFSFPDDRSFSKDIKNMGYIVAWADHYLVKNKGHFGEEIEKRMEYYLNNYGSKDWLGREGLIKRLNAWRNNVKPLRKSFLFPKEKVSPEKSNRSEECQEPQLWSMFDGWTAEMETIEFIYALIRQVKPKFVLETGTWHGIASVAIGKALKTNGRGKLITIEYDPEISNVARKRIDRYNLNDYVTILTQDSLSYQPKNEIDFLFLDSALDIRDKEFLLFSSKLKPGSLVVFHDTSTNHKVVREGIEKLVTQRFLKCVYLNSPRGLTICQYIKASDNNQDEGELSLVGHDNNYQEMLSELGLANSATNLNITTPVCVTGMHRSGTSMVVRILNILGLYLGKEEDMMEPASDNPEGFWENNRFVNINDEILEIFGGAWDLVPHFPPNWQQFSELESVKKDVDILLQDFIDKEHWGWKDPRNSLTLPFWQQYFPNMRVIICLRHPLEVAYSLQKRNGNSIPFGLNLWYQYNKILLKNISYQNRLIIHYDAMLNNVERELERIISWLGWTFSYGSIALSINSVKSDLRHNQESMLDFSGLESYPNILKFYKSLCKEAGY